MGKCVSRFDLVTYNILCVHVSFSHMGKCKFKTQNILQICVPKSMFFLRFFFSQFFGLEIFEFFFLILSNFFEFSPKNKFQKTPKNPLDLSRIFNFYIFHILNINHL